MEQIIAWVIVLATVPLWAITLTKPLTAYRRGILKGGYRTMYQALVALLSWYTAIVLVVFIGGDTTLGVMLSVLWAIGGLTWAAVATVGSTRRAVQMEHATVQAEPPQTANGYKVRTAPKVTPTPVEAYAPPQTTAKQRSARAQQALRKAVTA
jgi:uncharacterized membrane protein